METYLKKFYFLSIDIDLKDAAKFFSHKFSCGSSVTGDDEIVIQGDVKDDLFDIITEQWPEVSHLNFNMIFIKISAICLKAIIN